MRQKNGRILGIVLTPTFSLLGIQLDIILKFYSNNRNYVYNCLLPNKGDYVSICCIEINFTNIRAKSKF